MIRISGSTRSYAVLGHPVAHSLSPVMHNASIENLGIDAVYLAYDVCPGDLKAALNAMRAMNFGGVNLTVPLKETAVPLMSSLADSARLLGAVNTVRFASSGLEGHNTDGSGFLRALEECFGQGVEGENLLIIGCGGAGRAVALTAAVNGVRGIALSDIERERTMLLAGEIGRAAPGVTVKTAGNAAELKDFASRAGLIIQASPVGMDASEAPLLSSEVFDTGQRLFDLVYNHPETAIMREAKSAGAQTANGLSMLLHQGAISFEIWTGMQPDMEAMRSALQKAVYGE